MSYDPNWPQNGQLIDGDDFRVQFAGIVDLIQAGGGIVAATIDSVTTGNPGDPATAGVSLTGATLHFTFGLPRGNDGGQGIQGIPGNNGNDGNDGGIGPIGPPFANAVIDAVNTLNPGESATATVVFDGSNVRLTFGIPRGNDGTAGTNGNDGIQGTPGEVSNAALAAAIQGTSNNTNAVATLDTAPSDPPTLADYEALRAKLNELILNGRR